MAKYLLLIVILLLAGCASTEPTDTRAPTPALTATATSEPTEVPEISPIGDQEIVFWNDRTGNDEIFVVNSDGSDLLQVSHLVKSDE